MSPRSPSSVRVPTAPTMGALRWLRGTMVGLLATVLALGGHVLGAGHRPPTGAVTALVGLAVLVSVALSGVRWRLSSLCTVLLGAQVAFHVAFATTGHVDVGLASSHAHNGGVGVPGVPGDGVSARMLAMHVVAAAVTALLLRRAEAVCWQLVAEATRPFRSAQLLSAPPFATQRRPSVPVGSWTWPRQLLHLVDSAPRRGPPSLAAS